ncbi:MAG: hypothetical protein M1383_01515 [Patescibacteria group bacterium]|nr:hypothetical protein [Patescibacteria group bacterium]
MKALSRLQSAIDQSSFIGITALIALVPVAFPHLTLAAETAQPEAQSALVFEIKDPSVLNSENKNSITMDQVVQTDPLVAKVKAYLEDHGSPLAEYAAQIVQQPQWQRALGVSYVESNMGIHCYNNNCSGIGVKPGHPSWRKYATKLDWFIDLNNLLETPLYKEKYNTFQKMKGVYVQPGSQSWVYGAQKVYNELMQITEEANAERQQLAQKYTNPISIAMVGTPELAKLDQ